METFSSLWTLDLCYSTLESAVRWAAVFQKQLLEIAWPEVVLEWPMCCEVYDHENNVGGVEQLLWKGLRVRIGMACGKPQYRKPLNTGAPCYSKYTSVGICSLLK